MVFNSRLVIPFLLFYIHDCYGVIPNKIPSCNSTITFQTTASYTFLKEYVMDIVKERLTNGQYMSECKYSYVVELFKPSYTRVSLTFQDVQCKNVKVNFNCPFLVQPIDYSNDFYISILLFLVVLFINYLWKFKGSEICNDCLPVFIY